MHKYIISILLILNSLLLAQYEDTNPTKTTKKDLIILNKFEKLLYDETNIPENSECKQERIINFIYRNKRNEFNYSKLLVNLNTQVSSSDTLNDVNGTYKDRDKASIQLTATYPLFDKKTDLEITKKRIAYKKELINSVSKYCSLKNQFTILHHKLTILNLKQLRSKAREDSGQIYLDDRIALIEKIIETKNQISEMQLTIETQKLQLLNQIKNIDTKKLKEML